MSSEEYRLDVERKMLQIMQEKLDSGEMSAERAKEIAQYVVDSLKPGISIDEINKVVAYIAKEFEEFSHLTVDSLNAYEENVKTHALSDVHKLLSEGDLPSADTILKKTLQVDLGGKQ